MKISEVIEELQKIKDEHGDLEVFDTNVYLFSNVEVRVAEEGEFPEDWDMPAGYKFVIAGTHT